LGRESSSLLFKRLAEFIELDYVIDGYRGDNQTSASQRLDQPILAKVRKRFSERRAADTKTGCLLNFSQHGARG
jgi:hypothetical protein